MRGTGRLNVRILVATLFATSTLLAWAGESGAATLTARNSVEPTLVARINDRRAAHGLRRLRVSSYLASAASRHANSMGSRGYFRHELRKRGRWYAFGSWIRSYWPGPGYTSWSAGENLAWASPSLGAAKTVRMWMNSAGHRANLLGRWRYVGVAVVHVTAPPGYYGDYPEVTVVAAEFGRRS
jgi:uncharacterized protein YkwD